ncbi:uncharacterized protein BYT42DRAFT_240778 [Radiomyces spectabilis]|uniref:uncharacterized protein n=1 Tax=Radiomyces spectabilis TaxID=64574 RepID=UPI00221ED3BB|nr:uncharacterized protein BYT42DRAFT_240778 [Radiomyces spectabilis]KAI8388607.1 hypothetical protein BYT42DRAFT_240778 [Radiomyces spectabilis]
MVALSSLSQYNFFLFSSFSLWIPLFFFFSFPHFSSNSFHFYSVLLQERNLSFSITDSGWLMAIWYFENSQFDNAWIPFDRGNQKKLEFIYRHHDQLLLNNFKEAIDDIDKEEEDPTASQALQFDHNCLSITLRDSHFQDPITLYPAVLLGCLPDRDILISRAEQTTTHAK